MNQSSVPRGVIDVRRRVLLLSLLLVSSSGLETRLLTRRAALRRMQVGKCLSVKGAEDALNKPCAFEVRRVHPPATAASPSRRLRRGRGAPRDAAHPPRPQVSTNVETMYFIADTDKEKEDWINAIGRAIVRHSASMMESEAMDY